MKSWSRSALAIAVLASSSSTLIFVACTSDFPTVPLAGGNDTGVADTSNPQTDGNPGEDASDAGTDTGLPPGVCNILDAALARNNIVNQIADYAPTPKGGQLNPGTYVMTHITSWTYPDSGKENTGVVPGYYARQMIRLKGDGTYENWQYIGPDAGSGTVKIEHGAWSTSGTSYTQKNDCPDTKSVPNFGYTADGGPQWILYVNLAGASEEATYSLVDFDAGPQYNNSCPGPGCTDDAAK